MTHLSSAALKMIDRYLLLFRNPDEFVPERWLGDPTYKDDIRDAHQPFGVGTRNCLGMNSKWFFSANSGPQRSEWLTWRTSVAWHEMRLLVAKLIFNFDLQTDVDASWRDQNVFVIWDRKPLPVTLVDIGAPA